MSVAIFFLWLSVYIVSQTFPMLLEGIGTAWTFLDIYDHVGIGFHIYLETYTRNKRKRPLKKFNRCG